MLLTSAPCQSARRSGDPSGCRPAVTLRRPRHPCTVTPSSIMAPEEIRVGQQQRGVPVPGQTGTADFRHQGGHARRRLVVDGEHRLLAISPMCLVLGL